jgi:hypothetical protein
MDASFHNDLTYFSFANALYPLSSEGLELTLMIEAERGSNIL